MSYLVEIPVLTGMTESKDAIGMAEDYIGTYSLTECMPESVAVVPPHAANQLVTFVRVNVSDYRRRNDMKTIKKTRSIPNYLNKLGNER